MKRRSLKIVKVNAQKSPQYRQEFVNQPINYLKIIENKDKVKYEYLNKDFDPKHDLKQLSGRRLEYPNPEIHDPGMHSNSKLVDYVKTPALKSDLGKYTFDIPLDSDDEDYHPQKRSFTPPRPPVVEGLKDNVYEPPTSTYTPPRPQTITHTETYSPKGGTPRQTPHPTPQQTPRQTPRQTPQHTPQHSSHHTPQQLYNYDMHTPPKGESGGQYSKLRDFLNGSDNEESDDDYYGRRRNHKVVDPYKYMSESQKNFNKFNTGPPTLEELENSGEYSSKPEYMDVYKMDEMLRHQKQSDSGRHGGGSSRHHSRHSRDNYSSRSDTSSRKHSVASRKSDTSSIVSIKPETPESIDDKKRDLLSKLDMLRKKYPEQSQGIPFMTMNSSLKELEYLYYSELRKLEIDSDVNDYRTYLIGFFMITEFILGKFLRLDLEGFTQQQMLNMRRYERFLIEIGEKNYVPEGKKWPVEIRLVGFVLIQAAAFTASKMILKRTGTNLMAMFNTHNASATTANNGPKRKMKMPDIDLDDDDD